MKKRDREEEEREDFFFQLRSRKHVCVPQLSRRLTVFTFLQRLTTLSSLYARDWRGDFFRKANQQLRWKEFRRVALSLVFSRPELVAFINNPLPRSVFIQDELSFWWNWKFTRWKFPPPSVFSDNWLPSFSFRWLLLYAKKCTSLIRATDSRIRQGEIKKLINCDYTNLYTRFSMVAEKKVATPPKVFVPILERLVISFFLRREIFLWKIWKTRERFKIRSSWKSCRIACTLLRQSTIELLLGAS